MLELNAQELSPAVSEVWLLQVKAVAVYILSSYY